MARALMAGGCRSGTDLVFCIQISDVAQVGRARDDRVLVHCICRELKFPAKRLEAAGICESFPPPIFPDSWMPE